MQVPPGSAGWGWALKLPFYRASGNGLQRGRNEEPGRGAPDPTPTSGLILHSGTLHLGFLGHAPPTVQPMPPVPSRAGRAWPHTWTHIRHSDCPNSAALGVAGAEAAGPKKRPSELQTHVPTACLRCSGFSYWAHTARTLTLG